MVGTKQAVYGLDNDDRDNPDDTFTFLHRLRVLSIPKVRDVGRYCPLIAAILAPLSTLLDIPALSQRWYTLYDISQDDPPACLALSAVGLGLNLLANVLLLFRFSTHEKRTVDIATRVSLLSWLGKTIVAAVNLTLFGILTRNSAGYAYTEGFWCAVVSIIDSGIICLALLTHYLGSFGHEQYNDHEVTDVRMQGKQFMLSVTVLIVILGLQALAFCKLEDWTYVDGIYFSVQTALTIGFGDYTPTHAAAKVLVFIFAVLTISQLGNEIALIIKYFSARSEERRARWRRKYEGAMHREANAREPRASLLEEMALIHEINAREEMWSQLYDLLWSAASLVVFWLSGAAIFSTLESWTFGNGLYAVMVFTMTIGFGDYAPVTPAGKVIFIIYALMAVPIVTSFAVQTITGLLSTFSERRYKKDQYRTARRAAPDAFKPHAAYIVRAHESYREMRDRLLKPYQADTAIKDTDGNQTDGTPKDSAEVKEELNSAEQRIMREYRAAEAIANAKMEGEKGSSQRQRDQNKRELEMELVGQLMDLVVRFEAEARELLLESMEHGVARTLLLADRNVQIRDVKAVRGDDANILSVWRGHTGSPQAPEFSKLVKVRRYRNTFAEILVVGAILQRLEGDELNRFERWFSLDPAKIEEEEKQIEEDVDDLELGITTKLEVRKMKKRPKRSMTAPS